MAASITLGSVTLEKPVILGGKNPTSQSEAVLLGGKRDQDQELNYGTEFVIQCQADSLTNYNALLALIGTAQELVIDWGVETPDTESFGNFIICDPSWEMPTISAAVPWFVYKFTIRRHTAA